MHWHLVVMPIWKAPVGIAQPLKFHIPLCFSPEQTCSFSSQQMPGLELLQYRPLAHDQGLYASFTYKLMKKIDFCFCHKPPKFRLDFELKCSTGKLNPCSLFYRQIHTYRKVLASSAVVITWSDCCSSESERQLSKRKAIFPSHCPLPLHTVDTLGLGQFSVQTAQRTYSLHYHFNYQETISQHGELDSWLLVKYCHL